LISGRLKIIRLHKKFPSRFFPADFICCHLPTIGYFLASFCQNIAIPFAFNFVIHYCLLEKWRGRKSSCVFTRVELTAAEYRSSGSGERILWMVYGIPRSVLPGEEKELNYSVGIVEMKIVRGRLQEHWPTTGAPLFTQVANFGRIREFLSKMIIFKFRRLNSPNYEDFK